MAIHISSTSRISAGKTSSIACTPASASACSRSTDFLIAAGSGGVASAAAAAPGHAAAMALYGVVADIHGNREALAAALGALAQRGIERLLCLGDLIGYNADPAMLEPSSVVFRKPPELRVAWDQ